MLPAGGACAGFLGQRGGAALLGACKSRLRGDQCGGLPLQLRQGSLIGQLSGDLRQKIGALLTVCRRLLCPAVFLQRLLLFQLLPLLILQIKCFQLFGQFAQPRLRLLTFGGQVR